MKSIVITGTDVELNNALQKAIGSYNGELEIPYASPFSDDLLENIGFSQPDFIIADFLNEEQIRAILNVVLKTTIVFISEDTNRTNAVISIFNKEGIFDFINLDKSSINPKDVLNQLKDYSPQSFEEVDSNTPISSEKVENSINENNFDMPVVEPVHESESSMNTNSNDNVANNVTSNTNNYVPLEEPTKPKPLDNLDKDISRKQSSEKITSITQCQVVTLYSKKGGTGNTTIAKEVANIFANATLSKKISEKPNLDTCIVDLDFEQGNLRTILGIANPSPNVYTLIDAILTKMEQGIPLERVYFSEPEFKINYCIRLKNTPMFVLCLSQGDVPKRLVERMMAFGDDNIFSKIVKKIIQILKSCFNIVVIDTTSSYNDINEVIFRSSNKIIYPMEITLADLENLKVTLDETKENNYITNRVIPVLNKGFKSRFNESFLNVYEELQKENPDLKDIVGTINYDAQVVNTNNNYGFYAMSQNQFKQVIIALCHNILPIFKTKPLSDDIKALQKKRAMEQKKLEKQRSMEATRILNASSKPKPVKPQVSKPAETSAPANESISQVFTEGDLVTVREFISKDLSGYDINAFLDGLKKCSDISLTKKGFPKCATQPKTLNKKVWKQYYKLLSKNI